MNPEGAWKSQLLPPRALGKITEKAHLGSVAQRLLHCAMKGRWALGLRSLGLDRHSAIYKLCDLRQVASSP